MQQRTLASRQTALALRQRQLESMLRLARRHLTVIAEDRRRARTQPPPVPAAALPRHWQALRIRGDAALDDYAALRDDLAAVSAELAGLNRHGGHGAG